MMRTGEGKGSCEKAVEDRTRLNTSADQNALTVACMKESSFTTVIQFFKARDLLRRPEIIQ
jgi:hypothetical protein